MYKKPALLHLAICLATLNTTLSSPAPTQPTHQPKAYTLYLVPTLHTIHPRINATIQKINPHLFYFTSTHKNQSKQGIIKVQKSWNNDQSHFEPLDQLRRQTKSTNLKFTNIILLDINFPCIMYMPLNPIDVSNSEELLSTCYAGKITAYFSMLQPGGQFIYHSKIFFKKYPLACEASTQSYILGRTKKAISQLAKKRNVKISTSDFSLKKFKATRNATRQSYTRILRTEGLYKVTTHQYPQTMHHSLHLMGYKPKLLKNPSKQFIYQPKEVRRQLNNPPHTHCNWCKKSIQNKPPKKVLCAKCKQVAYCTKICQKRDWFGCSKNHKDPNGNYIKNSKISHKSLCNTYQPLPTNTKIDNNQPYYKQTVRGSEDGAQEVHFFKPINNPNLKPIPIKVNPLDNNQIQELHTLRSFKISKAHTVKAGSLLILLASLSQKKPT
ncbi:MAG: zinc finger MYND domain-containing protein [Bacteroidota bacterium]